jgi:hypothetical protein
MIRNFQGKLGRLVDAMWKHSIIGLKLFANSRLFTPEEYQPRNLLLSMQPIHLTAEPDLPSFVF